MIVVKSLLFKFKVFCLPFTTLCLSVILHRKMCYKYSMKVNGIRDMAVLKCIILPIYMGRRIQ